MLAEDVKIASLTRDDQLLKSLHAISHCMLNNDTTSAKKIALSLNLHEDSQLDTESICDMIFWLYYFGDTDRASKVVNSFVCDINWTTASANAIARTLAALSSNNDIAVALKIISEIVESCNAQNDFSILTEILCAGSFHLPESLIKTLYTIIQMHDSTQKERLNAIKEGMKKYRISPQQSSNKTDISSSYLKTVTQDLESQEIEREKFIAGLNDISLNDDHRFTHAFPALMATDDPELCLKAAQIYSHEVLRGHEKKFIKKHQKLIKDKFSIAYIAGDFISHPVMHCIKPILKSHDTEIFDVHCLNVSDKMSREQQYNIENSGCKHLNFISTSFTEAAEQIKSLQFDLIIDLSGHTLSSKPQIMRKLGSTKIVNYLGYPGTMGSTIHGYIIADRQVIPEKMQEFYTEEIFYLDRCFMPCPDMPHEAQVRATSKDEFIFGSINGAQKINLACATAWREILCSTRNSKLLLFNCFGRRESILDILNCGSDRVEFISASTREAYFSQLRRVNLFLDAFPYGMHSTCAEAASVGIPTLTLVGKAFHSRVAYSIAKYFDSEEVIARTVAEYIEKAITFANSNVFSGYFADHKKENLANFRDAAAYTAELERCFKRILAA